MDCFTIIRQYISSMAKKKEELQVEGRTVEVSNLEKVMFPKSGFTKGQVIDYYIRVSPVLLPHLKNRPLTMKRFPNGVESGHFYEKDAPAHTPKWVKTFEIPRKSDQAKIRYIVINDLPSLVWSANLANLEMHTFLARIPAIKKPDFVVFDLDPGPPADVLSCAQVAIWLREILDTLKLKCFVKVSGSKGIQLYIPLNTPTNYQTTGKFAHSLAQKLEQIHPDLIVSSMAKSLRKGKVFIDWSQNSDFKTTVSVYSLRAQRETPYVSMPVSWEELGQALRKQETDLLYFDAEMALKRVEKEGDIFSHVFSTKQKIPRTYPAQLEKIESVSAPVTAKKGAKASRVAAVSPSRKTTERESRHKKEKEDGPSRLLKSYNAKRDFQQTREPSGASKSKTTQGTEKLFVIQKHQASQLHYDFRLEMQGVLRSWAVPKGPPTKKGERRLAMHVEDHPMDYARFEGTIPRGNYGAGTVMVWDIGTYEVESDHPVRAYHAGKIKMILKGKKLKGEWTLIRAGKNKYGKESWFLIKTGDAVPEISSKKDDQSALTSRTMKQIGDARDAEWISNR